MKRSTLATILVLSHLLCVVFGYCIASIQKKYVGLPADTATTTHSIPTESTEQTVFTTERAIETTEEPAIETIAEETKATEEIETSATVPAAPQPSVTTPSATVPPVTTPPATEPPVPEVPATTPPVTESPATQSPATEAPGGNPGGEYETDRDY